MVQETAERGLLFGLLALQNDLVGRDALVAAFQVWSRDRGRSLAEILVEQGGLEPDDREAVAALVDRYLRRHGGDPEQSLAALPDGRAVRSRLGTLDDPELRDALDRLGPPTAADGPGDRTETFAVGASTSKGARFVLLRPLARGGIGQVGVALDAELNREVALKEIQAQLADDPSCRARFLLEAEVTGRLEHPGVVPVYGLGADHRGRPYYAMRLIRGDSLKQAIARLHDEDRRPDRSPTARSMALRELLNRFVAVCNAVAYAHSRGVIHRDLKPSNVMLGPYGETLVVDWGLAKVVGRDDPAASPEATLRPGSAAGSGSSETLAGTAVGTPSFMSPEQAEGRLDDVGPASDVYSLGATLYALLTGRSPIEAETAADALDRARRGDFPAPRAVNRRAPPGLEAIVLKAMAARPADRYEGARALAVDVEHWLADEPIAARRDPAPARLARWSRRHRTPVAAAAVLMVAAVVGLSAGVVLLGRANARTEDQRRRAEASSAEAGRQRDRARDNFRLAQSAVDENFVQISENTLLKSPLPGLQPLRRQLLESALKYYEQFLAAGDDPAIRAELARAYFRVGSITGELGTPAEALASFEKARELYEALESERPGDPAIRGDLARLHRAIGRMLAGLGRPAEATAEFRLAATIGEELVASDPEVPGFRHDLAWCYNNLGAMLQRGGQPAAGRRLFRRAITTWESLVAEHPLPEYRTSLATAYSNLGYLLAFAGRPDEALEANARAVALCDAVVAEAPADPVALDKLVGALDNEGFVATQAGRTDLARDALRRCLALSEPLARANPAVVAFQERLIAAHNDLGHLLLATGEEAEAKPLFESGLAMAAALPADVPPLYYNAAYLHRGLAKCLRREGRPAEALAELEEAIRLGTDAPGEAPLSSYERAAALALAAAVVPEAEPVPADGPDDRRRPYADRAIEALRTAVADGWRNLDWTRADPDLDALRDRDDFQAILDELARAEVPD